jgi:hypothetical protein
MTLNLTYKHPTIDIFWRLITNDNKTYFEEIVKDVDDWIKDRDIEKENYQFYKTNNIQITDIPIKHHTNYYTFEQIDTEISMHANEIVGTVFWSQSAAYIKIELMSKHGIDMNLLLYLWNKYLIYIGDEKTTDLAKRRIIMEKKYERVRLYIYKQYKCNNIVNKVPIQIAAQIRLNGQQLFSQKDSNYFNYLQCNKYESSPDVGYYNYSFSLKPLEQQPSGSANMTYLNDSTLIIECNERILDERVRIQIMGRKYSLLRFMSNIGGLAYN